MNVVGALAVGIDQLRADVLPEHTPAPSLPRQFAPPAHRPPLATLCGRAGG